MHEDGRVPSTDPIEPTDVDRSDPAGRAWVDRAVAAVEAEVRGTGRVVTRSFSGATTRLAIALPDGLEVQADVPSADSRDLTPGTAVTVTPAERPALVEPAREDVPA